MAHIAVVGKPCRLRFQVSSQINLQLGMRSSIHTNLTEVKDLLSNGMISVVCLVEEKLSDRFLTVIDEFNSTFKSAKLIFVGARISSGIRKQFVSMKLERCTLLDSSFELGDLKPVVRKMSLGQPVYVRQFFRHRMNQLCHMNTATSKQNTSVRVQDISKGGLMASYRQLKLKAGEVVHILMPTQNGRKQHRIIGHVAWHDSVKKQFGITFDKVSVEVANIRFSQAS